MYFTYGVDMNSEYKGHDIVTASEHDDPTGLWNGRYRILDSKGIVIYESFIEPLNDENEAHEAAIAAARDWIDRQ
jgi:hypothetical protein